MENILIILICVVSNIVSFRLGYKSGKDKEVIVVKQYDKVEYIKKHTDLSYEDEEAIVPDETEVKRYV